MIWLRVDVLKSSPHPAEGERSVGPDATFRTLSCPWNLARGFNATPEVGGWRAGVVGFSEAGVTTVAG
jgi:hypothetical protein